MPQTLTREQTAIAEAAGRVIGERLRDFDARLDALDDSVRPLGRDIASLSRQVAGIGSQMGGMAARERIRSVPKPSPTTTLIRALTVRFLAAAHNTVDFDGLASGLYGESSPVRVAAVDPGQWWKQRAITNPAMTSVSGWASELVATGFAGALPALAPQSVLAALATHALRLDFAGVGSIAMPSRATTPSPNFWHAEGAPIPVKAQSTTRATAKPFTGGLISTFSRELSKASVPTVESVIRAALADDATLEIDTALLDASAATAIRPAGLLNGVTAIPATGATGGTLDKIAAAFSALAAAIPAPVHDLVYLANPVDGIGFLTVAPALADRIIAAPLLPVGKVVALDAGDLFVGEDGIQFDINEEALIVERDDPTAIVDGAGVAGKPDRSLFQTSTIAIRMLADVTWGMRRAGRVSFIADWKA